MPVKVCIIVIVWDPESDKDVEYTEKSKFEP